jgi:hypothetical protein
MKMKEYKKKRKKAVRKKEKQSQRHERVYKKRMNVLANRRGKSGFVKERSKKDDRRDSSARIG